MKKTGIEQSFKQNSACSTIYSGMLDTNKSMFISVDFKNNQNFYELMQFNFNSTLQCFSILLKHAHL